MTWIQETLDIWIWPDCDEGCAHMRIRHCNSLSLHPCNVCLDCGEHGVKGGRGRRYEGLGS